MFAASYKSNEKTYDESHKYSRDCYEHCCFQTLKQGRNYIYRVNPLQIHNKASCCDAALKQRRYINLICAGTAHPLFKILIKIDCYALRALAIQPEFAIRAIALLAPAG